ncbi:MAG: hypothetical protein FWG44_05420 [Oscillospiraceae bacterium]|nr:hypothetical protein [Oscillospiraceae bacterium]
MDKINNTEKPKTNKTTEAKKHPHYGHRQRKKEHFMKSGLDDFPDHEKLEFMLFFAIPHGDTNELAHELINTFGSLVDVLKAKREDLIKVKGMGEHAACMIHFFRMMAKHFIMQTKGNILELNSTEALNNFCSAMYLDSYYEQICCLYLDSELCLDKHEVICEGSLGKVDVMLGQMTKKILDSNSRRIVLSHNHPNGSCMPSKTDIDTTQELISFYKKMDIEIVDHVIAGKDGVWSMREYDNFWEF